MSAHASIESLLGPKWPARLSEIIKEHSRAMSAYLDATPQEFISDGVYSSKFFAMLTEKFPSACIMNHEASFAGRSSQAPLKTVLLEGRHFNQEGAFSQLLIINTLCKQFHVPFAAYQEGWLEVNSSVAPSKPEPERYGTPVKGVLDVMEQEWDRIFGCQAQAFALQDSTPPSQAQRTRNTL